MERNQIIRWVAGVAVVIAIIVLLIYA